MSFIKGLFTAKYSPVLSDLETDIHSHFLPGIDDGCKTVEESVSLLSQYSSAGIRRVVCTPHIMKEFYKNNADTIVKAFNTLKDAIHHAGVNVEIHYAAEYFIDDYFEELIEKNEILHFGKSKFVLTELSYFMPYPKYKEIIKNLQHKGYTVILAHPERYSYWHFHLNPLKELHHNGVLMQVNLPSLIDYYGSNVRKQAITLIKNGLIDLAGGDIHNQRYLNAVINVQKNKTFTNAMRYNIFKNKLLY